MNDTTTGSDWNMSTSAYLARILGPKHLPGSIVVPITVAYALIFFTGIVGNVCTCVVIVKNRSMHNGTNAYLFSLAIADLLTLLLGLPNDLSVYWQQYPYLFGIVVCRTRAFVSEMTSNASVLTIVVFTTERYIAICRPLLAQTLPNFSRATRAVAVVWLVAGVSALPFAYLTTINYIDFPPGSGNDLTESAFCSVSRDPDHSSHQKPLFQVSSFLFFVVPLVIIVCLCLKIALALRASKFDRQSSSGRFKNGPDTSLARRSIWRILVAVVIAFFLCWAPFHAQRLLYVNVPPDEWTETLRIVNESLYYAAGCCYYLNCTLNPVLYNVMSRRYREAFKKTLRCGNTSCGNNASCGKFVRTSSLSSSISFNARLATRGPFNPGSFSLRSSTSCRSFAPDVVTVEQISPN